MSDQVDPFGTIASAINTQTGAIIRQAQAIEHLAAVMARVDRAIAQSNMSDQEADLVKVEDERRAFRELEAEVEVAIETVRGTQGIDLLNMLTRYRTARLERGL